MGGGGDDGSSGFITSGSKSQTGQQCIDITPACGNGRCLTRATARVQQHLVSYFILVLAIFLVMIFVIFFVTMVMKRTPANLPQLLAGCPTQHLFLLVLNFLHKRWISSLKGESLHLSLLFSLKWATAAAETPVTYIHMSLLSKYSIWASDENKTYICILVHSVSGYFAGFCCTHYAAYVIRSLFEGFSCDSFQGRCLWWWTRPGRSWSARSVWRSWCPQPGSGNAR